MLTPRGVDANWRAKIKANPQGWMLDAVKRREEALIREAEQSRSSAAHNLLDNAVEDAVKEDMARGMLQALKIGRRNSVAQAADFLRNLRASGGADMRTAAVGALGTRAARRIQRVVRKWLNRKRLLDVRLKLFAMDFHRQGPLVWDRPERVRGARAAEEPPPEPEPESEPDDDDEAPKAAAPKKPKRKPKKKRPEPYFPTLRPVARRRKSTFDPSADDPLPWAVPVDTSNDAVRSKPLPKKSHLELLGPVRAVERRRKPRDKIEEMEWSCRANSEMLQETLEKNLYDEQYRSVIDAGKNSTALTRNYNRVARHLSRVSYERVRFDCQCAMVIQLSEAGFLR